VMISRNMKQLMRSNSCWAVGGYTRLMVRSELLNA